MSVIDDLGLGPTLGGAPHTQEQVRRLRILQMEQMAAEDNARNALAYENEADGYLETLANFAGKPQAIRPSRPAAPALVIKVVVTQSEGGPLGAFTAGPERVASEVPEPAEPMPPPEGVAVIGVFVGHRKRTGTDLYQCPAYDTAQMGREVTVGRDSVLIIGGNTPNGTYRKIPSGSIAGFYWEKIA